MNINTLNIAGAAIELLSDIGDVTVSEVIDGLIGICFSEEEAGELKNVYFAGE
jgi:hypothetical protein